ncbi:MAG: HPF/RaiA family ribosome-associated protein [Verrucomicrobia bacterium]|nr:HPF/RaiA family ribosome-associated protein [Verrucomicrobiota bacterium]
MKLSLKSLLPRIPAGFLQQLRRELAPVVTARRIDEVRVTLDRPEQASPPWQLSVHLVTPGPDLTAHARGHTVAAAISQAAAELREQLRRRRDKVTRRLRSIGAPRGSVARA